MDATAGHRRIDPDTAEALAAALLALPPEDRARLAAVLLTPPTGPFEGEAADEPQAPQPMGEG